jgi:hypothetical protein
VQCFGKLESLHVKKHILAALVIPLLCVSAAAQSVLSPLNPPGWSDLDAAAAKVAYWVNGARICGIDYDPIALDARTQQFADMYGVSVAAVKREAPEWANRFAPNVTSDTCRKATQQAKQLGILAGYKPPRVLPAPAESLAD